MSYLFYCPCREREVSFYECYPTFSWRSSSGFATIIAFSTCPVLVLGCLIENDEEEEGFLDISESTHRVYNNALCMI